MSEEHYCQDFITKCTPLFVQGFEAIYKNTVKKCSKRKYILKEYQEALESIPLWNSKIIENEYNRFKSSSNCCWLDDLIKASLMGLTESILKGKRNNIEVTIPKGVEFIHKCYINIARAIWKKPQLFFQEYGVLEKKQNQEETIALIKNQIMISFKEELPMKFIIDDYLKNGKTEGGNRRVNDTNDDDDNDDNDEDGVEDEDDEDDDDDDDEDGVEDEDVEDEDDVEESVSYKSEDEDEESSSCNELEEHESCNELEEHETVEVIKDCVQVEDVKPVKGFVKVEDSVNIKGGEVNVKEIKATDSKVVNVEEIKEKVKVVKDSTNTKVVQENVINSVNVEENIKEDVVNSVNVKEDVINSVNVKEVKENVINSVNVEEDVVNSVNVEENIKEDVINSVNVEEDVVNSVNIEEIKEKVKDVKDSSKQVHILNNEELEAKKEEEEFLKKYEIQDLLNSNDLEETIRRKIYSDRKLKRKMITEKIKNILGSNVSYEEFKDVKKRNNLKKHLLMMKR